MERVTPHPNRLHPTALGLTEPGAAPKIALRDFVDIEKWTVEVHRLVDWSPLVRRWFAFLNTRLGDCTCASAANGKQIACAAVGEPFRVTNADVLRMYEHSGYVPGQPGTDCGWTLEAAEQYMQTIGLLGTEAAPQPDIVTAASVAENDPEADQVACELFGGMHIAAQMPQNAQTQYSEGRAWKLAHGPGSEPGSWGGHALWVVRILLKGFAELETWGGLQAAGSDWRREYVVDKRVLVWTDWERALPEEVRQLGVVDFGKLESLVAEVG